MASAAGELPGQCDGAQPRRTERAHGPDDRADVQRAHEATARSARAAAACRCHTNPPSSPAMTVRGEQCQAATRPARSSSRAGRRRWRPSCEFSGACAATAGADGQRRHEGCVPGHFASSQLPPTPALTVSGGSSSAAPTISRVTISVGAVHLLRRPLEEQLVVDLEDGSSSAAPPSARALWLVDHRDLDDVCRGALDDRVDRQPLAELAQSASCGRAARESGGAARAAC